MRRRDFVWLIGGATVWPHVASAQQQGMPVIGYLNLGSAGSHTHSVAAFRKGLGETGYAEGRNVTIAFAWAESQPERLAPLAVDLVRRKVDVIVATGGFQSARAAKAATETIPIIFSGGGDPVKLGWVASLSRPGGNMTGFTFLLQAMEAKRLELLRELVPAVGLVGMLFDPSNTDAPAQLRQANEAARGLGLSLYSVNAGIEGELDAAFATLAAKRASAVLLGASGFFFDRRRRVISLAAGHRLPTIYFVREFAIEGGLTSYGTSVADGYYQVGRYAGRVLKGEKPSELPVVQSTKYELVVNLNTAKTLGLTVPSTILAYADEVIE